DNERVTWAERIEQAVKLGPVPSTAGGGLFKNLLAARFLALVPFNSNSEVSPRLCRGTHRGLTLLRSRKMGRVILHDTSSLPSPPFVKGEGRIAAALGGSRCYGHL